MDEVRESSQIPEAEAQDAYVLSPAEQSALVAGHPWSRFAVLGDSIALGMGDPAEGYLTATWGERVAAALAAAREDLVYVNLGEHGATAAEIRDRQLDRVVDFEPDLVAVVGGGNDVLAEEFDLAPVEADLDEIVAALSGAGATVITYELLDFAHVFPDGGFEELSHRLQSLYAAMREIAQERRTVHVDLSAEPWAREPYCFSADLKHPTIRAQAYCASTTIRALGEHLRRGT